MYTCLYDSLDVLASVRSAERIYTYYHFGGRVIIGFQCIIDEQTGCVLFCHGNRILEVEHDRVRTVNKGILHHSRVIARNEHHRSS